MEQTLIVLIAALLVALIALIVLQFLNWRKTTRCHAALERLFADAKERQTLRTERIEGCLIGQYHLNQQTAQELAAALFFAEILFLTQFFELQARQQSVEDYYDNLCELLDSYLEAKPEKVVDASMPGETAKDLAKNTLQK